MRFRCGIPLSDHFFTQHALLNDLDMGTLEFLGICNIDLAHTDLGLSILNQNNTITCHGCSRFHFTLVIDCEGCLCCYCITFRRNCLTKDIFHTGLETFDLMGLLTGCPLLNDRLLTVFILLNNLNLGTFKLIAVRDIDFTHSDLGLGIIDQQRSVCCHGTGRGYLSTLVETEFNIRCNSVTIRCHRLTKCIFYTCKQAFDLMGFLYGIPFINNVSVLIDDLDMSSFKFFSVRDISLAYFNLCLSIFNQQDAVLDLCIFGRDLALFINREGCVRCDSVAIRRHCLTQRVLHAGLQTFNNVRIFAGNPLFGNCLCTVLIFLNDLDRRSFKFFSACDVNFAYLDDRLSVFNQKYSVLGYRSA